MPFTLDAVPQSGELRQGELLLDIWVHRVPGAAMRLPAGGPAPSVDQYHHAATVVIHSDCDLLQDFRARTEARQNGRVLERTDKALVNEVLMCDAFLPNEIHERKPGRDFRKRVAQNQEERYHTLEFRPIQIGGSQVSTLVLDFRKTFSIDTENLYAAIAAGGVQRVGLIPDVYVHDLMHRSFGYMSRVGLPDEPQVAPPAALAIPDVT